MVRERDKGNDMEEGGKYLLASCSRDHQVGEPILFYGNPAPPLGAYNSERVPEGATQRNRFRGNKKSGEIRIKGFIVKRMEGRDGGKKNRYAEKFLEMKFIFQLTLLRFCWLFCQYLSRGKTFHVEQ
jgi:hypothetical protein